MRWSLLPVGLQRPSPRHILSGWAHSGSLIVSGGCTPAAVAGSGGERCYSDMWKLSLDGLVQGGKRLNITAPPLEGDEAVLLLPNPKNAERVAAAAAARAARASGSAASPPSGSAPGCRSCGTRPPS